MFPLLLPHLHEKDRASFSLIAGDIGGTKTHLGFFWCENNQLQLVVEATYATNDYNSFLEILDQFIQTHQLEKPHKVSLGCAGAIVDGVCHTNNIRWKLSVEEIKTKGNIEEVYLLNDLDATAYGLASLKEEDLIPVVTVEKTYQGSMAILAPGTGLGEAFLLWDGSALIPMPSEGGHSEFSPRTDRDWAIKKFLEKKYGQIVIWERLISGPGIANIFHYLMEEKQLSLPDWMADEFKNNDASAIISQAAIEGKDEICKETMDLFINFMARRATNLALNYNAIGGVILGGGIPPKIRSLIDHQTFTKDFRECDELENLINHVPVHLNLNAQTGFWGAAYYGAFGKHKI